MERKIFNAKIGFYGADTPVSTDTMENAAQIVLNHMRHKLKAGSFIRVKVKEEKEAAVWKNITGMWFWKRTEEMPYIITRTTFLRFPVILTNEGLKLGVSEEEIEEKNDLEFNDDCVDIW